MLKRAGVLEQFVSVVLRAFGFEEPSSRKCNRVLKVYDGSNSGGFRLDRFNRLPRLEIEYS